LLSHASLPAIPVVFEQWCLNADKADTTMLIICSCDELAVPQRSKGVFPGAQEIVVFRDNLQNRMRKLCLLAPNGALLYLHHAFITKSGVSTP